MQFSKLFISLATATLITNAIASPIAIFNKHHNRDDEDDDGPVIVHLTTTKHQAHTNIHTVQGQASTTTDVVVNTNTKTVTRYTATITSTVFGTEHVYTTVATTPVQKEDVSANSDNLVTSSTSPSPKTTDAATTTSTTSPAPQTTQTPKQAVATSTETTSPTSTSDDGPGPTITNASNIPTSTGSWLIDNVSTSVSGGVCYVDYDYYNTDDAADETVTSTSTIYTTVTQA